MDSPEQITARVEQAGFAQVAVQSDTATFAYASPEEWWKVRWSIFFRGALEALTPSALADLEAEALAHAREMHAQGELITEQKALYTLARS
jgi:hypothetical protein